MTISYLTVPRTHPLRSAFQIVASQGTAPETTELVDSFTVGELKDQGLSIESVLATFEHVESIYGSDTAEKREKLSDIVRNSFDNPRELSQKQREHAGITYVAMNTNAQPVALPTELNAADRLSQKQKSQLAR